MKTKTPFFGDRIDRKAKIAQRLHRNERRHRDDYKYEVFDEDEDDSQDYTAPTGKLPFTRKLKEK